MNSHAVAFEGVSPLLGWEDLCDTVWQATAKLRTEMHVRQHGYGCPTPVAPYGKADPTARRTKECCRVSGCLDLFHDLLVASSTRLSRIAEGEAGARARDPRRYAYVVVTRLLVDLTREQRVRAGYPARPGRLDGEARRVVDALEAQDPECAGWLIALFRMIRDYAHKQGRVASSWPYDGWAAEKTHYVGNRQHPVTRDEVRSDIAAILETARSTLGAAWVYTNVYQPLRSASGSETLNEAFLPTATEDLDILLLSIWLRQAYVRARRGGMATSEAFKLAATLVTGLEAPALTAEIRISLRDLEQDLAVAA